jgi:DNA-binding GntR family transcriptional regulator
LEHDILLGRLLPRERLTGESLALRFNVSRNAVRRALGWLETMGIVASSQHRGAWVRDFTPREIEDLVETRAVLQRHACARLSLPADLTLLERLERLRRAHADAVPACDLEAALINNAAFHDTLVRAAGNDLLADTVAHLSWKLTVVRSYRMANAADLARGAAGHAEMVAALRVGDRPRLQRAIADHVSPPDVIAQRRETWRWQGEVVTLR